MEEGGRTRAPLLGHFPSVAFFHVPSVYSTVWKRGTGELMTRDGVISMTSIMFWGSTHEMLMTGAAGWSDPWQ